MPGTSLRTWSFPKLYLGPNSSPRLCKLLFFPSQILVLTQLHLRHPQAPSVKIRLQALCPDVFLALISSHFLLLTATFGLLPLHPTPCYWSILPHVHSPFLFFFLSFLLNSCFLLPYYNGNIYTVASSVLRS